VNKNSNIYKKLRYFKNLIVFVFTKMSNQEDTLDPLDFYDENIEFNISEYEGRFGNNIQQIINGIIFAKLTRNSFESLPHPLIKKISFNKNDSAKPIKSNFFYYKYHDFRKDFKIENQYLHMQYPVISRNYIYPNLTFVNDSPLGSDTLVIHIRSGDNFGEREFNKKKRDFMIDTNPISYFEQLIKMYKKVIVVTEKDMKNPIINKLAESYDIEIQSSSLQNDFNTLLNAQNLASSGISTFPIAAALCSKNLKNFYHSGLINQKHLNPELLKYSDATIHNVKIKNLKLAKSFSNYEAYCEYLLTN
tara:strand:- start:638 stop:1552 length:915 start_codon:yes stop_codon:yes gene_type:complete